jgi:DNA primase
VRIPPEKIDEIRNATDIVEYISSFTQLKKRGKNFIGLCPFHSEKTPSFTVSADKQMYHCFGCGVGGNIFTFVMEHEKVSFGEAVKALAERAGIVLPRYSQADDERASENEHLYALCREAALYYYECLMKSPEGGYTRDYFHNRGFTDETVQAFGLGYSPNSWTALLTLAQEKKFDLTLMEKAGLLRRREDGSYHDYFHGRAMFPILTGTGRVVGFGARKLHEDDPLGKYINSPETPIFNKSRLLYGLTQAKDSIREKGYVLLVEGYADVLSVYQAGFRNVVASSGTALTIEQIRLIARYAQKITLLYDADSAGSKATLRGVDMILENDCDVQVAVLTEGEDPDSYIRRFGNEAFKKLVDESESFVDFIARSYERQGKLKTPEGETETVRAIVQTIARMKDELKRNFFIKHVAEKYRIYESTLYRELEKSLRGNQASQSYQKQDRIEEPALTGKFPRSQERGIPQVERDLLSAILEGSADAITFVDENLNLDLITSTRVRSLVQMLIERIRRNEEVSPSSMIDILDDEEDRKFISELLLSASQVSKQWDLRGIDIGKADPLDIVKDAIRLLKKKAIERRIVENQQLIKDASAKGQDILQFLEIHQELIQSMKDLGLPEKNDKKEG